MIELVSTSVSSDITVNKNFPTAKRIAWLDSARGICIILVVVGHTIGGLRGASLATDKGLLVNIFYFIYTFHMAAFFVLSGILARPNANKDAKRFFNNILKNILYPYFLFFIFYFIWNNSIVNNEYIFK